MLTTKNFGAQSLFVAGAVLTMVLQQGCQPPGPKALLKGERDIREGHYAEAVADLKTATELLPKNAQAWNHLGLAYHGAGQPGQAVRAYQQAIGLNRNLSAVRFNLGSLYLEQNLLSEALGEFTTFTGLEPNSFQGWVKLGTVQRQLRKLDEAEKSFFMATRIQGPNAECLNGVGLVQVLRRRPQEAYKNFVGAQQRDPGYAPAVLNQAIVAQQFFGNKPLALQKYREYAKMSAKDQGATSVAAQIAQLEAELAPRPVPVPAPQPPRATNPPPTAAVSPRTNAPTPPAATPPSTNAVAVVKPVTPALPAAPPTVIVRTQVVVVTVTNNPSPAPVVPAVSAKPATNKANLVSPLVDVRPQTPPAVQTALVSAPRATNREPVAPNPKPAPAAIPQPAQPVVAVPPPPATNRLVAVLPPPPSTPAPSAATEAPAVAVKANAPAEPPIKEVVKVTDDFVVAPAKDIAIAANLAAAKALAEAPAKPEEPLAAESSLAPLVRPIHRETKPGLLDRMNPTKWFKGKTNAPAVKPEPAPPQRAPVETRLAAAPVTEPTPPPAQPEGPRYQYSQAAHPPGDRAAAEPLFGLGFEAQSEKRLAAAIEAYQRAVRIDPAYFDAYYNLGLAAYESKELPLAIASFEHAVRVNPASADARYNFALTLQRANYFRDAAAQYQEMLDDNPDNVRARFALGNLCARQLNQPQKARQHYVKVLELAPQHPQAAGIREWLAKTR